MVSRKKLQNWVVFMLQHFDMSNESLSLRLKELWKTTYQAMVVLVNDIPNLQYMAFYEMLYSGILPGLSFSDSSLLKVLSCVETQFLNRRMWDQSILGYLNDIIDSTSFRLISANLNNSRIASLTPFIIPKFDSIRRLGLTGSTAGKNLSSSLNYIFRRVYDLVIIPQHHHHVAHSLVIPTDWAPKLDSYMAPGTFLQQIFPGLTIHSLHLTGQLGVSVISMRQEISEIVRVNIRVLDVSSLPEFVGQEFKALSNIWPNV
ncbi:hypothetical protein M422DRAFT_247614 [Sphaerobolus stellatus SS14]|nr:hypothetical protein M422DRAFT_247614 [Sphaerobolus stellatus SS14]